MKISAASVFLLISFLSSIIGDSRGVAAFTTTTPPGSFSSSSSAAIRTTTGTPLRMSDLTSEELPSSQSSSSPSMIAEGNEAPTPTQATATTTKTPVMSQSLPFLPRPSALDGTLAGDVGFDPLGFAQGPAELMNYREAEIKHARLAMLAAAGWPLSELWDRPLASWLHWTPILASDDRAPSVLNGGLGKVSPVYWIVCLIAASAIESYGLYRRSSSTNDYFPGNLGFDPFGLYPKTEAGQLDMQLKEIKNGRLAMIAITAFAVQEFVSSTGVIDETPFFFKPLGQVLHEYANSGYILH